MSGAHLHSHAHHGGDDIIARARSALTASGEQWTNMREAVFTELARHERPASAYLIADNLSRERGKRVAPNSIYRILDLFVANDLALRIESANAYLVNSHPGQRQDCVFLVCEECGEASHVHDESINASVRTLTAARDFRADHPVLEIRGVCCACI